MIEHFKGGFVQWQESEEKGIGEPALLVKRYTGLVEITQEGRSILINGESLNELFKNIKNLIKE